MGEQKGRTGNTNGRQEDVRDRNVSLLVRRFPEAAQQFHRSGLNDKLIPFTATHGNRQPSIFNKSENGRPELLCSADGFDQLIDNVTAAKLPEPFDVVIFMGFGLGQVPTEAVRCYTGKPHIIIVEPFVSIFRLALETTDLETIFNYERLHFFIGDQADPERIIDDLKHLLPVGRTLLFIHPYDRQVVGKRYKQVEAGLVDRIRSIRDLWHTTRQFGPRMLSNTVANLPSLLAGPPLHKLEGRCRGVPAICIAAGPSLNQALPALKTVNNALVIACDSAVGNLLQAGIQPHFVTTVDIHPANSAKLAPYMDRLRESVLAFGVESNPDNVRSYLGLRRVGVTAYSKLVLDWLDPILDLQCRMPSMTSVTHLAVLLANVLGADPIILVGVDQAYLNGQSHSVGSVAYHISTNEKLIPAVSTNGRTVYAPAQLVTDRLMLERHIAAIRCRVINTSFNGAYISGVEVKSMDEMLSTDLKAAVDVDGILDSIPWDASDRLNAAIAELTDRVARIRELKTSCERECSIVQDALAPLDQEEDRQSTIACWHRIIHDHDQLLESFDDVIPVIRDSMLTEEREIIRQQEINTVKSGATILEQMKDTLNTLIAKYNAMISAADSLIALLEPLMAGAKRLGSSRRVMDMDDRHDMLLDEARWLKSEGEIWLAVAAFEHCIRLLPSDPVPYVELIETYIQMQLWETARRLLDTARSIIGDSIALNRAANDLGEHADQLLEQTQAASISGNYAAAERLLGDYSVLRPGDPRVSDIQKRLKAGKTISGNPLPVGNAETEPVNLRLKRAASLFESRQFDKGIGVLEGICSDVPALRAMLRAQIGDVRMMQKDYASAVWNYQQAGSLGAQVDGIQDKIDRAEQWLDNPP